MISLKSQRVIYNDNGTLADYSAEVNDFNDGSMAFSYVAGEDYLYIGSELPFCNRYVEVNSAAVNDQAANLSVDIWFGKAWVAAVDLVDRTESSGVPLAQSGLVHWSTNRLKGWDRELDSADVTGLSGTVVYNMYWARLSYDGNLKAATAIKYIGYKFAADNDLYAEYPELNNSNIRTRFASGKTDWNEQHYLAAGEIIKDLKAMNVIVSANQLADLSVFERAAVHKAAEIIYQGMGPAQYDKRDQARRSYKDAMNVKYFRVDLNADGKLGDSERYSGTGWMSR